MTINDHFADWHRAVSIDLVGVDLAARWDAVESIVSGIDAAQCVRVVEWAFGQDTVSEDDDWFRRPFKDRELSFPMKGNDREMAMLSGAVITETIDRDDDTAVLTAYLCVLTKFQEWREPFEGLVSHAQFRLSELATINRTLERPPVQKPFNVFSKPMKEILDAVKVEPQVAGAVFDDLVIKMIGTVNAALLGIQREVEASVLWAESGLEVAREESGLLWWLLSGRSQSLEKDWDLLAPGTVATAAARELADLVTFLPAPDYCDAALIQLVSVNTTGTEAPVVESLDIPEELNRVLAEVTHHDLEQQALHEFRRALVVRAWEAALGE